VFAVIRREALYDAPMLRASIALFVAGCFAPDPTTGAPCASGISEEERCPSGQVCVAHDGVETCETMDIDENPVGDRDKDMIIDAVDNCPDVANKDQADEDLDRAGDVCDPCPPFQGTEDADQDGVGDACDPNPTTAGDKLVSFTGFNGALASPWTTSGMFIVAGGEGLATANDTTSAIASMPSPTATRVEVRTQARVVSITAAAGNLGAINIVERFLPADDRGIACQLSSLANGDQQQLRIFDLDKKLVIDTAAHPLPANAQIDLRLRRTNDAYSCRATNPVLELAGTATFAPQGARIGVRVRGATAIFHWVMVVTSPSTSP
jgi:hypothetical protein